MAAGAGRSVRMGVLFYPRGGSAQVVRYLSRALPTTGWQVSVAAGSLGPPLATTNAGRFYDGLDVVTADFTAAVELFERGDDPMAAPVPLHPSYENRPGVPDRVFAEVSPELAAHQVDAWTNVLAGSGPPPRVLHLHHLTPIHEAAARCWPDVPVLTHLHGTELKMLAEIARRAHRPGAWPFGTWWAERMVAAARRSDALVTLAPAQRDEAIELLGVDGGRIHVVPNGVDTERFRRRELERDERSELWRRWLVDDARGWDRSGEPGSVRYDERAVTALVGTDAGAAPPVLLFVGRFLAFKRVPLLLRAYARARPRFAQPTPLVVWGGNPGEWEGEHPYDVAREERVDDSTFFTGWRGHDELPVGLSCADVLVAPSTDEPFGQVLLEAMVCGLPVIATTTGGPPSFVNTEPGAPNGWLVPPDDVDALADVLVEAVNDAGARHARGANAIEQVTRNYAWRHLARRFAWLYDGLDR